MDYWLSQLLTHINNYYICIYSPYTYVYIYTYAYIVKKRQSPPIPRPCDAHKVDTSAAIRRRFSNITSKKLAIPRL